jgi:hypothetical protein
VGNGGRAANRLLSGRDIDAARAWAARRPKEASALTALHLDFLRASEEEEARRQSPEAQRLQQVAEAQAARGAALEEKATAQEREAKQARLVVRRTLTGLAASLVLAVAAAGFAFYASLQKGEAVHTRDQALLAQSKFLADMSQRETMQEVGPGTGLLLALEALRDEPSDEPVTREPPKWKSAEITRLGAKHLLREQMVLKGHDARIVSVAMM